MLFRVEADIAQPPERVFAFLRDIDQVPRDPASVVPVLEKTSSGPYGVGSTFHEVVRVLPRRTAEIHSEITRFEAPTRLDYAFTWRLGPAELDGELRYELERARAGVTHLVQTQTLRPRGALRLLAPLIRWTFGRRIARRLRALKAQLEAPR